MARRNSMTPRALRIGSVGRLLPLLTVAGVCSFTDRRDALSSPPNDAKTSSSNCVSTTALLIFRGLGAGLAWTISVDGYALASMKDEQWKRRLDMLPGSSIAREAARSLVRHSVRNMLGFASFLGIFGGMSCILEKMRGKNDLFNSFAGGFTAGIVVLPVDLRNPRTLVTAAFLCGSASMALHHFIPNEHKSKNEIVSR